MRYILSWCLYWTGDLVSKPMRWNAFGFLYPFYNWLMITSCRFDPDERIWLGWKSVVYASALELDWIDEEDLDQDDE